MPLGCLAAGPGWDRPGTHHRDMATSVAGAVSHIARAGLPCGSPHADRRGVGAPPCRKGTTRTEPNPHQTPQAPLIVKPGHISDMGGGILVSDRSRSLYLVCDKAAVWSVLMTDAQPATETRLRWPIHELNAAARCSCLAKIPQD